MATPAVPAVPGISFDLNQDLINKGFLDGSGAVSVSLTAQTDASALTKIVENAPLGNDEFVVGQIGVTANSSLGIQDVKFLNNGTVSFSGSASAYAALAVYPDPTSDDFITALTPVAETGLALQVDPNLTWCILRWGASEDVSGSGSIAFAAGSGSINISAQEHGELFYAVLRQVPRTTLTRDALASVVHNWRLPSQVKSDQDLDPGTYLLAELGGSLSLGLDVTFGHSFNWVRQTQLGQLTGDIGLKVQLGLEAKLGLSTQGKYALVVARESLDPAGRVLRARIYRLRSSEFDFALSLSAAATGQLPVSDDYHDLIEAALGVHGLQILKKLESWTDPNSLPTLLKNLSDDYVSKFLQKVTGLTLDQAKAAVSGFITKWNNLPHAVASLFAAEAAKVVPDFSAIKALAQTIATQDHAAFVSLLSPLLGQTLSNNPAIQWLESIAEHGALTLLQDVPGFNRLQSAAQGTLDFLNGTSVETLLSNLLTEIEKRTGLDAILNLAANNFAGADELLLSRLTDFLDHVPGFADIQALQTTIHNLLTDNKIEAFYKKAIDALTTTYTAQLNVAYQSTTSDTALVDISFDFKQAAAGASLAKLLAGKLDDLLTNPVAGVTLNQGVLTHSLKRTAHVDFTLPFIGTGSQDWVSNAAASFNAIDQDNGRLSFFQVDAASQSKTMQSIFSGRNWRSTTLTLSGFLPQAVEQSTGLLVHPKTAAEQAESATAVSSLRFEVKNMTRASLDSVVGATAEQFLITAFPTPQAFDRWADLGKLLATPANTVAALDISIPAQVPLAWLNHSPARPTDTLYMNMSIRVQKKLKSLLSQYIFLDPAFYGNLEQSAVVLVYQSIRPANSISIDGDNVTFTTNDVYWDAESPEELDAMVGLSSTRGNLAAAMAAAHTRLLNAGLNSTAGFYTPDQRNQVLIAATQGPGKDLLQGLVSMESLVVNTARDAGLQIAQFQQSKQNSPSEAITHLAQAGQKLTSAFNTDLATAIVGDALLRLSALVFADAALALDPTIPSVAGDAVLNVIVLKPGASLPADFPDFKIDPADIQVSLNAQSLAASARS